MKVFSGMGVYQIPAAEDQARFGALYQRCREMDGVAYVGSLAQPALAVELAQAAVLAYPNSYPETSCIAVREALAAGCTVVTSARAALPETSAGFARLVPSDGDRDTYTKRFVAATVQALTARAGPDPAALAEHLGRQLAQVQEHHTWPVLAEEWVSWLCQLRTAAAY